LLLFYENSFLYIRHPGIYRRRGIDLGDDGLGIGLVGGGPAIGGLGFTGGLAGGRAMGCSGLGRLPVGG